MTELVESLASFPTDGIKLSLLKAFRQLVISSDHTTWTTSDVCNNLIIPWTSPTTTSFINYLKDSNSDHIHPELQVKYQDCVGERANYFVSHAWKYNFIELVDAVEFYFIKHEINEARTYLWFDLLVNNQNAAPSYPFEWWSSTFLSAVGSIGHTLAVFLPWQDPIPLTRAWCIWEIYCTHITKAKLSIALSPQQEKNFLRIVLKDSYAIIGQLCKIDIHRSSAYLPEDRERIFQAVESTVGSNQLNIIVSDLMRTWVLDVAREHFQHHHSPSAVDDSNPQLTETEYDQMLTLSHLLIEQGKHSEAIQICETCIAGLTQLLHPRHRKVLDTRRRLATYLTTTRKDEALLQAISIFEEILPQQIELLGALDEDTVISFHGCGTLYSDVGNLDRAEDMMMKAIDGYIHLYGVNSQQELYGRFTLATLRVRKGMAEEARTELKALATTYDDLYGSTHPMTLHTLNNLATIRCYLGEYALAVEDLQKVLIGYQKTLGVINPNTVRTALVQAAIHRKLKSFTDAIDIYVRLKEAYLAIGMDNQANDVIDISKKVDDCRWSEENALLLQTSQEIHDQLQQQISLCCSKRHTMEKRRNGYIGFVGVVVCDQCHRSGIDVDDWFVCCSHCHEDICILCATANVKRLCIIKDKTITASSNSDIQGENAAIGDKRCSNGHVLEIHVNNRGNDGNSNSNHNSNSDYNSTTVSVTAVGNFGCYACDVCHCRNIHFDPLFYSCRACDYDVCCVCCV